MKTIYESKGFRSVKIQIKSIAYHRNGISGEGFHVVLFSNKSDECEMMGIVFPLDDEQTWNGRVAVFDTDKLSKGDIEFMSNSWRGDVFEWVLRDAIKDWNNDLP